MSEPGLPVSSDEPTPENRPLGRSFARVAAVIVVALAILYAGVYFMHHPPANQALNPATSIGRSAPDFALSAPDGHMVHLSDFRGKAVLLNFYGNSCVPCRTETPWLVTLQQQEGPKGVQILAVEMEGSAAGAVKKFADEFKVTYPMLVGSDPVADTYGVEALPTSYFIDRKGRIVAATIGLRSESEIERNLALALAN